MEEHQYREFDGTRHSEQDGGNSHRDDRGSEYVEDDPREIDHQDDRKDRGNRLDVHDHSFERVWAAVVAALPEMGIEERVTLAQHAKSVWDGTKPSRSTWFTRETLRIIASDPSHPLYRAAGKALERMTVDDRHR